MRLYTYIISLLWLVLPVYATALPALEDPSVLEKGDSTTLQPRLIMPNLEESARTNPKHITGKVRRPDGTTRGIPLKVIAK